MYELKIFSTKDAPQWTQLLERLPNPDIYFTPEYLQIYESHYKLSIDEAFCGEAMLCFFGNEHQYVLYPVIKRSINDLPFLKEKASYPAIFDLISPYGYSGPIFSWISETDQKNFAIEFRTALNGYCKNQNIITEFIRFHPLLQNYEIFEGIIPLDERNLTVYVDLNQDENELLAKLNKKTRNLIRKAQKSGVQIEKIQGTDGLDEFTQLYLDTMQDNEASDKYLFPHQFFVNTSTALKENIILFIAKWEGKVIAASLFMHKYEYLHYHFSGSDRKYRNLAPNNLLLWEVVLWGKKKGYQKFHLGGGLTLSETDSLFHFKAGFSQNYARFYTGKVIHNQEIYEDLCAQKNAFDTRHGKQVAPSDFFPYYRKI